MMIEISDRRTLDDIDQKFNEFFPLLKLQFFSEPHHWYEANNNEPLRESLRLEDVRRNHVHDMFEFFSHTKTGEFESIMRERFGLNVQVLRYQGNKWMQTTGTDHLTLAEQQQLAKMQATG